MYGLIGPEIVKELVELVYSDKSTEQHREVSARLLVRLLRTFQSQKVAASRTNAGEPPKLSNRLADGTSQK